MEYINVFGLIIIILIMLPNLLFKIKQENKYHNKLVNVIEQIGRYGSMIFMIVVIPEIFYGWETKTIFLTYAIVNGILVLLYTIIWLMTYKKNSVFRALSLSIIPSIIFIFSGIISGAPVLLGFGVIFAPAHILISYKNAC